MEFKQNKKLKYMTAIITEHPCANAQGVVYEHHYVMFNKIGRPLQPNECVHHIDRDRSNNDISNLRLMTKSEHAKLHMLEDRNGYCLKSICPVCKCEFEYPKSYVRIHCSNYCYSNARSKFNVTREELNDLVWKYPTTKVAEIFGVSDKAVEKRCKKLGIDKPPRGYWTKIKTET